MRTRWLIGEAETRLGFSVFGLRSWVLGRRAILHPFFFFHKFS